MNTQIRDPHGCVESVLSASTSRILSFHGADVAIILLEESIMMSTRLYSAIRDGCLQTTNELLDGVQDINVHVRGWEQTPLHVACIYASLEIAEFLLQEKNANVNAVDVDGCTPLSRTCQTCETSGNAKNTSELIADLLLANGARVNTKDSFGNTALHQACRYGTARLVQVLLTHGAAINVQNSRGATPLCHACFQPPQFDVIEVLIANNADRHIKGNSGKGPLDLLHEDQRGKAFMSYDLWPLAVSGVCKSTPHATCEEEACDQGSEVVRLNPDLNHHQRALGLKTLLLVRQLPVHEVAYEILGFLSPASVEKIFLPTVCAKSNTGYKTSHRDEIVRHEIDAMSYKAFATDNISSTLQAEDPNSAVAESVDVEKSSTRVE